MARRLPDRPPNGIGFGSTPKLVPRQLNVDDARNVLSKPFKVPYKVSKPAGSTSRSPTVLANTRRVLRERNKNVSYKGLDGDGAELNSLQNIDGVVNENGELIKTRRKDALSARRLAEDPERLSRIELTLRKTFNVPIKGYTQRHSLPLTLGTKRKIISEPRPLHDPSDELAIVLYDPSVDGDMIIQEDADQVESIRDIATMGNKKEQEKEKEKQKQMEIERLAHQQKFSHRSVMPNGIRNKPLTELLKHNLTSTDMNESAKKFPSIPVVLDPMLVKILRPHQVEGVKFLYRCVTGLVMKDYLEKEALEMLPASIDANDTSRISEVSNEDLEMKDQSNSESNDSTPKTGTPSDTTPSEKETQDNSKNIGAYGCIMADEMGLGKTLQCITLMWTLLKQGPKGKRLIDKCIIVCPSSLVNNWANELIKWLGPGTLTPLAIDGKKSSLANGGNATVSQAVRGWAQARGRNIVKPVLIISYETLRRNVDQLQGCKVGLMLADEGHRLKNGESLTFTALNSIDCPRRVILSGTPIQNDLSEYFSLLNFSNPGLLGTRSEFRRNFEIPILNGRDSEASDEDIKKGERQLQKLSHIVSKFIIRRTNDILSKYLPCKYEHVIFVNLKPFQRDVYKSIIKTKEVAEAVKNSKKGGSMMLRSIGLLKKLCNHPDLINLEEELDNLDDSLVIPDDYNISNAAKSRDVRIEFSGKFAILERFLHKINTESNDKIVLISNYTQTLDLIEKLCRRRQYGVLRLDGTMNINKRQKLVDRFNSPDEPEFIFLLSSKAGGCGINLIGANRLILLDPDWNPASDQQALARVWRDGQKKDCFIYRFISTGTIEEKVFQRQSMKMSLSSCVVDEKEDVERLFSTDNLKQLFQLNEKTICDTHETYGCKRCDLSGKQRLKSPTMLYGDATSWNHLNHQALEKTNDHLLRNEFGFDDVSYAFQYISH
ncbi:hypothetical protein TPHA_0D00680 [Tetrapisispora phaffii CBS 4417]|uniref:DNA helicase n=1 Tax=Tetrapisispora phaffii (strain ATCC 24235 / CBS 4417 / NBRC 1672 / NRRL Y-8282 / UCD 70-5) TaxID=1071381 RepID=G8BS90_TETPH|nr:hypothetical protein TPHA_0D00680 [Tetrapisispora phaffii CBS 4417]CCE62711.1 hypothetical protein TPHA_0D00680 [Tetrapisispora phaffii CBS 4417]